MRKIFAAVLLLAMPAAPALAADFAVVHVETIVAAPLDKTWSRVGPYCAVKDWLGLPCQITSGSGEVGTIRHLKGAASGDVDELMISKTRYSYGYMVLQQAPILLHGELAAEPVDAGHTKLTYTMLYDQAPLATPADRAAALARRNKLFSGALAKMKTMAEAP